MPVTAEQISGERPGFVERWINTTATDIVFRGPTLPVALVTTRVGSLAGVGGDVTYDAAASTIVNGIVTVRLRAPVAAIYRIVPIYGVTGV